MKSFKHWKRQEVEEVFGIQEVASHPLLEQWLSHKCEIVESDKNTLFRLQKSLVKNVDLWNEAELKIKFLGPLLELVDYDTDHYRSFMERKLIIERGEEIISGTVDFLIAKGRQIPRSPFFCVHEYKPEPSGTNDPLGQLLIGLQAIHLENQKNGNAFPLYGSYVVGGLFYFVVFDGQSYAKSQFFSAHEKIFDVYCFLRQVKVYIEKQIAKK
ncbi:MAG: hypothetical protein AAF806_03160 [Bacteroidota bacterium]